jgi:hypothetical protein
VKGAVHSQGNSTQSREGATVNDIMGISDLDQMSSQSMGSLQLHPVINSGSNNIW